MQAAIAGSGVAALLELIQASRSTNIWAVCASAVAEIPVETARRSATAQLWSVFMMCRFLSGGFHCAKPIWWPPLGQAWASPLEPAICGREAERSTKTAGALAILASWAFIGAAGAQEISVGRSPRSGRGAVARGGDTAMKTKSHGAAFAIPWPRSCGRAVHAMCRWLALPIWRARSRRQGTVTPPHPKNLPDIFQANDVPAMSDKLTMLK